MTDRVQTATQLRDQRELDVAVLRASAGEYEDSGYALADTPGLEKIAAGRRLRAMTIRAIGGRYSALVDRVIAAELARDEWRTLALALGVHGEGTRDTNRMLLDVSIRVDAGVLRLGGAAVADDAARKARAAFMEFHAEEVALATIGDRPSHNED